MHTPSTHPGAASVPGACDERGAVSEIALAITAAAEHPAPHRDQADEDLVRDVRRGANRVARTIWRLCRSRPDRAERLARVLRALFVPATDVAPGTTEFAVQETAIQGEIDRLQLRERAGALNSEERARYVALLEKYAALLSAWLPYRRARLMREAA